MAKSRVRLTPAADTAVITREAQTGNASVLMQAIETGIQMAASQGINVARVNVPGETFESVVEACVLELRSAGYAVKREQGSDQREGLTWDYLAISWNV